VKVLLDECLDWRLARDIVGHDVKAARQMGWTTIKNGELLALAAKQFDVFVTVDRNLSAQQNLSAFAIAVIVIRARSNRLADLRPLIPALLTAIGSAQPGVVTTIGTTRARRKPAKNRP
jgi:hypothetical protein